MALGSAVSTTVIASAIFATTLPFGHKPNEAFFVSWMSRLKRLIPLKRMVDSRYLEFAAREPLFWDMKAASMMLEVIDTDANSLKKLMAWSFFSAKGVAQIATSEEMISIPSPIWVGFDENFRWSAKSRAMNSPSKWMGGLQPERNFVESKYPIADEIEIKNVSRGSRLG